jgi:lipid-binding SYLF domain-containing protein
MCKANVFIGLFAALALMAGCAREPRTQEQRDSFHAKSMAAVRSMEAKDPYLHDMLNKWYGYCVFPEVGKGGAIIGGATGRGEVYRNGQLIGHSELKQATVGAQLGGQTYTELIVFDNQAALDRFTSGQYEFSANASAVALKEGTAKTARFEHGIAVFTMPTGGLMFEASIGGQKFTFEPISHEAR